MYEIILFELKTAGSLQSCLGRGRGMIIFTPQTVKMGFKMIISLKTTERKGGGKIRVIRGRVFSG